jgi:hypothetical protein
MKGLYKDGACYFSDTFKCQFANPVALYVPLCAFHLQWMPYVSLCSLFMFTRIPYPVCLFFETGYCILLHLAIEVYATIVSFFR